MTRTLASPPLPSQDDQVLGQAATRFNATGAIWPSAVLAVRSGNSSLEGDPSDRLFQVHERSCRALASYLSSATRRHSNPLKVVTSFAGAVCHPRRGDFAALGAIWSLPAGRRRDVLAAFEDLASRLASVLEAGRLSGAIRDCDCRIAAQLVLGLALWTPVAVSQAQPRKLLNGRRIAEGLQDLLTYGRGGGFGDAKPLIASRNHSNSMGMYQDDRLRLVVSRTINRAGAEAVTAARIAAELDCTEGQAADALRGLDAILACQQRTIGLVLQIRDQAFPQGSELGPGFPAFMRGLAEAYLREDLQPLSPLALPRSPAPGEPVQMRWRMMWELLRKRQVDGVAKDELRERFYDLSPVFVAAICASLCSGVWARAAHDVGHTAQEIAALVWRGLAPPPRL